MANKTQLFKLRALQGRIEERDYELISDNIVSYLKGIHSKEVFENDWEDEYIGLMNLAVFNHGLIKKIGLKDYILVDFIEKNKFIIKDRKTSKTLEKHSLMDLVFDDKFNIMKTKTTNGDYVVDFYTLNVIAIEHPKLAKMIVSKYFSGGVNRKFFRLLSLYTAVYCLNLIAKIDQYPQCNEYYQNRLDNIFDFYEDFTVEIPTWFK